jgi:hypothetical protein
MNLENNVIMVAIVISLMIICLPQQNQIQNFTRSICPPTIDGMSTGCEYLNPLAQLQQNHNQT